jgi:hypothetical protein
MRQTRRKRGGAKNTTLKAQKKEEALILKEIKALKVAQKKEEAQILKDVKAQKKEEKARIKEEKARIKALKKTKKAQPKVATSADVEKLALELYKKSSAMKAQAKADIIDMGRDVDKERIDIVLENNFYWLIGKEKDQVWLDKARAKLNK